MMKVKLDLQKRLLDVPALLLTTLMELNPDELKTFQSYLTSGQLLGIPPIPWIELENTGRQDTVDQKVKRYGPGGAVGITVEILRRTKLDNLAGRLQWSFFPLSQVLPLPHTCPYSHPGPKLSSPQCGYPPCPPFSPAAPPSFNIPVSDVVVVNFCW
eukprot:XP_013985742.1 PREDICTED: NACHT, LRR and PYD domains-containing protein 6-like isoform X1 [Salmo salar]